MRVAITGATGLIGRRLVDELRGRGDHVVALSRSPDSAAQALGAGVETQAWENPTGAPPPPAALEGADAVINLLGESIAQRWSSEVKERIRDSRVLGTRQLLAGIEALAADRRPKILVSGSATGFYGPRGDEELTESAAPGDDFLSGVVTAWEAEATRATELGLRVVLSRTGVVVAPSGGALEKMLPPFKAGVGGPVAGGRQYLPWVHVDDVVGALVFLLDTDAASGPANVTAPTPVTNRTFSTALGHALHRPAVLPVPGFAIGLLYGEMATIVTTGQRAVPARLRELGYPFRHPELEPALRDVLA